MISLVLEISFIALTILVTSPVVNFALVSRDNIGSTIVLHKYNKTINITNPIKNINRRYNFFIIPHLYLVFLVTINSLKTYSYKLIINLLRNYVFLLKKGDIHSRYMAQIKQIDL
jgi:hypothetical protein